MSVSSKYIPTLDGWRAIAIAGVILSHSFPSTYWTAKGALGVNLFFAISGFLITSRLLAEREELGSISLAQFYKRRAFRILPAALFYLGVVAILSAAGVIYSSGRDLLSCLIFLRNYLGANAHDGWYTGHFWSLSVEEQFYLFWPAILLLAGSRRARWIAPALALIIAVWRSWDVRHAWVANHLHWELMRNYPLRSDYRMDAPLWGCTLALIQQRTNLSKWIPNGWGSAVALAALAGAVAMQTFQPQSYMVGIAVLMPVVLLGSISDPRGWLGRLLESKPLRWVGRISYSLYVWQQMFVSQYHHGVLQHFPQNMLLAVACACASYYLIERPMIRWGHRVSRRQTETALVFVPEPAAA